jgi:hypothetical protein
MADDVDFPELEPDETLQSIYDRVLAPAFTADELEPLDDLRAYLRASPPEAFGLYAAGPGGDPIGCCIYYPNHEAKTLLLGYMAVVADGRSRQVGSRLFEKSKAKWFGAGQYDLVMAELDDPRVYPVANGIDPERRIQFYSKLGGQLVCGPYFAPCVRPGGERVYDMLLTVLGGSSRAVHDSPAAASVSFIAAWLKGYFSVETDPGHVDGGDLDWLMASYEGNGTVDLIPVAEYRRWDPPRAPSRRAG